MHCYVGTYVANNTLVDHKGHPSKIKRGVYTSLHRATLWSCLTRITCYKHVTQMHRAVHSGSWRVTCGLVVPGLWGKWTADDTHKPWHQWALWKRKEKVWGKKKMRRERGIGFCIQRGGAPGLVPVRIKSFYGATFAHSFWHTNSHVFSGWWWNKSCFQWWQEGPKGGDTLYTSQLYTLSLYIYMHINFLTLTLFCLRACVQYLSLSSSLPHSGSLFLDHYFFLTSHCLSTAIKITT